MQDESREYRFLTQSELERFRQLAYYYDMRLIMKDERLYTVEEVRQFRAGSEVVEFRDLIANKKYYMTLLSSALQPD